MLGSIAVTTLVSFLFALSVARPIPTSIRIISGARRDCEGGLRLFDDISPSQPSPDITRTKVVTARPCDTTNVAPWMENSGRLCKASLFSSYVGDYHILVFKFPLTPIESVISREKVGRGSFSSLACEEAALAGPGGAGGAGWACWV